MTSLPSSLARRRTPRTGSRVNRPAGTVAAIAVDKGEGVRVLPRVLALDVDGTLVGADGRVSRRNKAALREALRMGVRVVLVTGRHPRAVVAICRELSLSGFHICLNGAAIMDPVSYTVCTARVLSDEHVDRVVELFRKEGYGIALYRLHDIVTDSPHLPAYLRTFGEDFVAVVPGLDECRHGVLKVVGVLPPGRSVNEARAKLTAELGGSLSVTSGDDVSVEVMHRLATKGDGLRALCAAEGFSASDVVAVGDSYNDVDMFSVAAHRVAVANAVPEVKCLADFVVSSCDEDGVAEVVRRFWGGSFGAENNLPPGNRH